MTYLLTSEAKWIRVAMFAVLFMVIPAFVQYVYLTVMPQSHWVQYESLQVANVIKATDTVEVISFAEIKRPVSIKWNDILYCKNGGGYEFVHSADSDKVYTEATDLPRSEIDPVTGEITNIPWRFPTENKLISGETCYIQANVTADFGNIKKTQTIQSNEFLIK